MATGGDEAFLRNVAGLTEDPSLPAVLVLGGSTFMGRALVEQLVALPARICLVNRGRKYWGIDDPSGGRAARVMADRRDVEEFGRRLDAATEKLLSTGKDRWDLVADFSAYNGKDIRASLGGLKSRFRTYAYISSDSVYEVSTLAASSWMPPPRPTSAAVASAGAVRVDEGFSSRPQDKEVRRRLKKADDYGDGKLEAEEALQAGIQDPACRSVSMRLPDVIGPFDDTLRLWAYWHWLQAADAKAPPPQVRKRPHAEDDSQPPVDPRLAFVFNQDVARFIVSLLQKEKPAGAPQHDAVNLGCLRQEAMPGFLGLLAAASGLPSTPEFKAVERPRSFLPSVDRPWPLCCKRMQEVYGFTATPLEEVLKACADWFASSCTDFPKEARKAARKVPGEAGRAAVKRARLEDAPRSSSSDSSSSSS
eukprot:TRINITY_DN123022_c0_g1_i1.p1 TRINITY_DN123022_c0_g1~~TRINITY_DN123022_c0_g1_i1.p1  ORF type:complete len:421 (+),score=105.32 TRINITY_DN123022_c0_g1_i1:143-1405(+)